MSGNELYTAVPARTRLSDIVSRQLQELIASGKLLPGEKLPPERDLAESFNVSRTVVREAIQSLTGKGLLEVSAGSGATISIPETSMISNSLGLIMQMRGRKDLHQQLFEVRRLLEVEVAGLAAERRNDEDLARLEEVFASMEQCDDVELYAAQDVAFHEMLAQATHNDIYPILLDSVVDHMLELRRISLTNPGNQKRAQRFHTRILDRVRAGDGDGARQAMREHLDAGEEDMRRLPQPQANEDKA